MQKDELKTLLAEKLSILNRPVYLNVMSNGVWINYYNVPPSVTGGADRENNRMALMLEVQKDGKVKVLQRVNGYAFLGKEYKLRAKTTTAEAAVKYAVDFLIKCSEKTPHGDFPGGTR